MCEQTRYSLLERVKNGDRNAWGDFHSLYFPLVCQWCRRWGLQEADAEDVAAELCERLGQGLANYDRVLGKFRSWLRVVTMRAVASYFRHENRHRHLQPADHVAAGDDLFRAICLHDTLETAMRNVRKNQTPRCCNVWELVEVNGKSVQEAATQLEVHQSVVYRDRVTFREALRGELVRLNDGEDILGGV